MTVIRKAGDLRVSSQLPNEKGFQVANDFLNRLVRGFIKRTSSYIRVTGEVPFVFREKQLHSFLSPSLDEFTEAFLFEPPVERKWSSISTKEKIVSHGWVDYWCRHRNVVFILELKHDFISWLSGEADKKARSRWRAAAEQVKTVIGYAKEQSEGARRAFRMILYIIPVYGAVTKTEPQEMKEINRLLDIEKNLLKKLSPKPNWSAVWQLHEDLYGPYHYGSHKECYPGVLFVSRLI